MIKTKKDGTTEYNHRELREKEFQIFRKPL